MKKGIFSESDPKVPKVTLNDNDSHFECYDRSDGRMLHVDVDNEMARSSKPTLALLPNRSEEDEMNNNGVI